MLKLLLTICLSFATVGLALAQANSSKDATPGDRRVMGDLSKDQAQRVMDEFDRALGVECSYCHVQGQWLDDSKPAFATSQSMYRMVHDLNDGLLLDVGTISCWTCHRGQVHPSRLPRPKLDEELARWPKELASADEGKKLVMAVYSVTLGVKCDYCHTEGDWKNAVKPPMKLVSRMNAMFAEFPKYMPPATRTQCWMCHQGVTKPQTKPST